MKVTPLNAVAVTEGAWDARLARQRQAERLGSVEQIVIRLMSAVERNIRRGVSPDQVEPVVRAWAGRLAPMVRVTGLRAGGVLVLTAQHPAVIMELKPKIHRLLADLKTTGIKEVRFA